MGLGESVEKRDAIFMNLTNIAVNFSSDSVKTTEVKPGGNVEFRFGSGDECVCRIYKLDCISESVRTRYPQTFPSKDYKYFVHREMENDVLLISLHHHKRLRTNISNRSSKKITLFMRNRDPIIIDSGAYTEYDNVIDITSNVGTRLGYINAPCDVSHTFDDLVFRLENVNTTTTTVTVTDIGG